MQWVEGKGVGGVAAGGHLGYEVEGVCVFGCCVELGARHGALEHHGKQGVVHADLGLSKLKRKRTLGQDGARTRLHCCS